MLRLSLILLFGLLLGIGIYTFRYAEGLSYFSTDPKACTNCHIMKPNFDSWQKSSHHTTASCVDCHLPHSFIPKYIAKGDNGYRHSKGFTLQDFHEPIIITPKNSRILQDNCLRCHTEIVSGLDPVTNCGPQAVNCVHCHIRVGHGEVTGLGKYDPDEFPIRRDQ